VKTPRARCADSRTSYAGDRQSGLGEAKGGQQATA
jgi:hypothetical protein